MLDADHAEVQYTLLHDGQPQFGLRTGVAVRIDGRWMVSRATECALLSLGGITCPPRTWRSDATSANDEEHEGDDGEDDEDSDQNSHVTVVPPPPRRLNPL